MTIEAIIFTSATAFFTIGLVILGWIVAEGERALNSVHDKQ